MPSRHHDSDGVRQALDQRILGSLFSSLDLVSRLSSDPPADLPPIVFENRRRRARQRLLDALASRGSEELSRQTLIELGDLARRWAARAFEDSFPDVDDFEIRMARQGELLIAAQSGDHEGYLRVVERDYRRRIAEEFGKVELWGIQTTHRVTADLDQVYVPLCLRPLPAPPQVDGLRRRTQEPGVDILAAEVLRQHRHVLIEGRPGSGKSTLVRYLARQCATGRLAKDLGWENDPLPLVLAVGDLDGPPQVANAAKDFARQLGVEEALVETALQKGRAVIFVDGLDGAPPNKRGQWAGFLHEVATPENRVIATSRPSEIESGLWFLEPFELHELTREESARFIDNWCLAFEVSGGKDSTGARRRARAAAEDLKTRVAVNHAIQRLVVNPLLATILCGVHRFLDRKIPEHRVTLYEKCTDALLYEWDQPKLPKESAVGQLDANQKKTLLRRIARQMHNNYDAEIAEPEVVSHLEKMLHALGRPPADAQEMVDEIRYRSGLLVWRRPEHFSFWHLAFQEYFTALDYVQNKQWEALIDRHNDPWWQEVIALAAGVPGADAGRIVGSLLAKKEPSAVVLAALCLETAVDMPSSVRQRIEKELEKLIPPETVAAGLRLSELGVIAAPLLVKALSKARTAEEKTAALFALQNLDYEPAIPVITQLASESETSKLALDLADANVLSIGEFAVWVLITKAVFLESDAALRAAKTVLRRHWKPEALRLFKDRITTLLFSGDPFTGRAKELALVIGEALKASTSGKRSSKRARSTA